MHVIIYIIFIIYMQYISSPNLYFLVSIPLSTFYIFSMAFPCSTFCTLGLYISKL